MKRRVLDFYGCTWLQRNMHPAAYCSFQLPFLLSRNSSFLNPKKKVKVCIERWSCPVNFRPQMTIGWQREGCNQERLWGSLMTRHSSAVLNASRPALGVTGSRWCAARNPTGTRRCAAPAFLHLSPPAASRLIRDRDRFDSPPDVVQSYGAPGGEERSVCWRHFSVVQTNKSRSFKHLNCYTC